MSATQCKAGEACVLPHGHADYCLHDGPLHEELGNIVAAGEAGRFPGDTLSHRTANYCVTFGWAERTDSGNLAATPRGRALLTICAKEIDSGAADS